MPLCEQFVAVWIGAVARYAQVILCLRRRIAGRKAGEHIDVQAFGFFEAAEAQLGVGETAEYARDELRGWQKTIPAV
jgi:hypothetical protein